MSDQTTMQNPAKQYSKAQGQGDGTLQPEPGSDTTLNPQPDHGEKPTKA